MQPNTPLKYENVTPEQFDQVKAVAKARGLNLTLGDANEMYDGISVKVKYDSSKRELVIESYQPFWMAPGVVAGHFHELVTTALYQPKALPAQPAAATAPVAGAKTL